MANKPFKKLRFSLTGDTYSPVDEQARQNIGDLSQLETTNKSNLVEAINEAAQSGDSGSGVPSGGSKGQVLTKRSSVEGDAGWEYPPVMYATGNDPSNLTVSWNENYTVMDFFMRQSIVQAEYEDSYVVHLKLIKAYITAVAPDFTSVYHFFFGAVSEIVNGTATFGTLEVVCDNPSAHSGVGVYSEVGVGVSDEAVQDAIDEYLTEHPALTGMFTNAAKSALIALLEKVAYIDGNGQQYLDELITNLGATVTSISAVFTQGDNIFCTVDTLDDLKPYLVVTASYSDGTSSVTNGYELSGTLEAGTNTITVNYGGQTDTFTVTGVRTATKLFSGAVWHFFGTYGTGSVSGSSDISASFNTTADTTAYNTGFGGDSSSPTSAYKTFGQIKGHRIRTYLNCNSVSGGNSTSNFTVSAYLGDKAYNGTRKKYKVAIMLSPLSTGNLFNDLIIPVSVWDETDNVWGGSGTVSDSDYFSIRAYFLTAVATSASFTIVLYDLGAET